MWGDHLFRLVDTAGIRSKARTQRGPEVLSVVQARKRVEECDVALLVLDASEGPTAQDASVAAFAHGEGKGIVLVANKWDVASEEGPEASKRFEVAVRDFHRERCSPGTLRNARHVAGVTDGCAENSKNGHHDRYGYDQTITALIDVNLLFHW